LELYLLGPSTSYFFGDQRFRFDIQKESLKIFIVLTPSWSNIIIFQSLKWYCGVFFSYMISNMSSLNLYGYNYKKIDSTWLFIQFRANSKRLKTSLEYLWVNFQQQFQIILGVEWFPSLHRKVIVIALLFITFHIIPGLLQS